MNGCQCLRCQEVAKDLEVEPIGGLVKLAKWLQQRIQACAGPLGVRYYLLLAHDSGAVASVTSLPPKSIPDLVRNLAEADAMHDTRPKAQA